MSAKHWVLLSFSTSGCMSLDNFFFNPLPVDEYAFELAAKEGAARPYAPPASYAVGTPMPTAAYSQNMFYLAVSYMLSLVLTMCQLFPVSLLTKVCVCARERAERGEGAAAVRVCARETRAREDGVRWIVRRAWVDGSRSLRLTVREMSRRRVSSFGL